MNKVYTVNKLQSGDMIKDGYLHFFVLKTIQNNNLNFDAIILSKNKVIITSMHSATCWFTYRI